MPGDGSTTRQANKFYLPILSKEEIKLKKEILEVFCILHVTGAFLCSFFNSFQYQFEFKGKFFAP